MFKVTTSNSAVYSSTNSFLFFYRALFSLEISKSRSLLDLETTTYFKSFNIVVKLIINL